MAWVPISRSATFRTSQHLQRLSPACAAVSRHISKFSRCKSRFKIGFFLRNARSYQMAIFVSYQIQRLPLKMLMHDAGAHRKFPDGNLLSVRQNVISALVPPFRSAHLCTAIVVHLPGIDKRISSQDSTAKHRKIPIAKSLPPDPLLPAVSRTQAHPPDSCSRAWKTARRRHAFPWAAASPCRPPGAPAGTACARPF